MMVILPADPLRQTRPDDHFAAEAAAARDAGIGVALVDHDALARGADVDRAVAKVPAGDDAVYRGWMLRSEQYAAFASALARRGVSLRTSAKQYQNAHELPGWYPTLAPVTPASVWTTGFERADFERARAELGAGPAVVRDYTKSMKHYWQEAMFIPDLDDAAACWAVASRFLQLREDSVVGGFVLRRFEQFTSAEVRTWWLAGECRLVGPHPDNQQDTQVGEPDLAEVTPLVASLNLPFVTVDLAERADGGWRVVELGDGQVSDRPTAISADTMIATLAGSEH